MKLIDINCTRAFIKRNVLEMLRDPIIYVFCIGFPVVMLILFQVINLYTAGETPMFEAKSLIPGITVFSFSFVALVMSLLVSKDRSSAFLIRLFASPMGVGDFILGYSVPCLAVGVVQEFVCIFSGWIIALAVGAEYFTFGACLLLALAELPMLLISVFIGIFFGSALGEKSAPGICSVFISASGILGGAWMPLDAMGGFESFCRFLPFYPSTYLGRVITGATHTLPDTMTGETIAYSFDIVAKLSLVAIAVYLVLSAVLALLFFNRATREKKR